MKSFFYIATAVTSLFILSSPSQGQIILWGTAQNITADTNVSTLGTYVDAATFFQGTVSDTVPLTVNSVVFNKLVLGSGVATDASGNISSTFSDGVGSYASALTVSGSLSQQYSDLNATIGFGEATDTVTLNGLTAGHVYQVQSWSYYNGDGSSSVNTYSGANSPVLNTYVGQFDTGTFTSLTGSAVTYTFNATGGVHNVLDAVSVRDITGGSATPEPSTLVLLGLGFFALIFLRRRTSKA